MPVATRIQWRRDTAANFTSTNPVLSAGEPAFETDTKKTKIGDGTTAWTSLAYNASGGIVGGGSIYVQQSAPSSPVNGDLWVAYTP